MDTGCSRPCSSSKEGHPKATSRNGQGAGHGDITPEQGCISAQSDQLQGERGRTRVADCAELRTTLLCCCEGMEVDANCGSQDDGCQREAVGHDVLYAGAEVDLRDEFSTHGQVSLLARGLRV